MAVAAMAAPEAPIKFIPVLERTEKHDEVGQFALRYVSADGTTFEEQGVLKPTADGKDYVLVKEGHWEHIAPNGQVIRTKYVADEKGFRAEGEHLPKSVVA